MFGELLRVFGRDGLDFVGVDTEFCQSFSSGLLVGLAGLVVAESVVVLALGFFSVELFASAWRNADRLHDHVGGASHLLRRQQFAADNIFTRRKLLTNSSTEQLAQDRHEQMPKDATPAAALGMVPIRRLWRFEKHEFDDSVPRIYLEATGEKFPIPADDDNLLLGEDWQILKEVCGEDPMFFELQGSLLDVERECRRMSRRAGIYEALEDRFKACQFESEQEALLAKQAEDELRKELKKENERSLAIVPKSLSGEEEEDGV